MRKELKSRDSVTRVIVEAVAEVTGQDPTAMRPFAEAIDTDAVESLFSNGPAEGPPTLTVTYEGCRVTVDGGVVTVEPGVEA